MPKRKDGKVHGRKFEAIPESVRVGSTKWVWQKRAKQDRDQSDDGKETPRRSLGDTVDMLQDYGET